MSSSESDIGEGIVPEQLPEHIAPPRTEFLPWHKVRKQYIRRHQWNELAKRNVNDAWRSDLQKLSELSKAPNSTMSATHPLRCLVIPGNHLLDIRSMWNEVSPLDCLIRYLGFNEGQGSGDIDTDVYVANNAVTSLAGVVQDSFVLKDRFEDIASETSQAYKYLRQYGPYHVVNLDLCGSMFPNTASRTQPYYDALHRLLQYQFKAQKTNWLLYITTMVEPAVMDKPQMQKLCGPTRDNSVANNGFAEVLLGLVANTLLTGVEKDDSVNLNGLSEEQLISLFGVALGKYLIKLGQSASPKWSVGMRRSFRYAINETKGAVMLSFAFEMKPNFASPVDSTGMSTLQVPARAFPSEYESAIKLAKSVGHIKDVDSLLAADADMKTSLRDEAADLLEAAGFDRSAYIKWVDEGESATSR